MKDWRQAWQDLEDFINTIEREECEKAKRAERPMDVIFEKGKIHTAMVILGYMSEHSEEDEDGHDDAGGDEEEAH